MSTATLDRPTLRPAHPRLPANAHVLVPLEVLTATAGAWLVRLPGGSRKAWLAYSVSKEVQPDREIPAGARMFSLPVWKQRQLSETLSES